MQGYYSEQEMRMLKHNSVVKFGSFKLRIFEGKEKIDIIQVKKNLCDIQYGIIPIQVTSMELSERLR